MSDWLNKKVFVLSVPLVKYRGDVAVKLESSLVKFKQQQMSEKIFGSVENFVLKKAETRGNLFISSV